MVILIIMGTAPQFLSSARINAELEPCNGKLGIHYARLSHLSENASTCGAESLSLACGSCIMLCGEAALVLRMLSLGTSQNAFSLD